MIIGECPYEDCSEPLFLCMGEYGFTKDTCEGCGRIIWTLHSRLDPCSYTERGFQEEFKVDEERKTIEYRNERT